MVLNHDVIYVLNDKKSNSKGVDIAQVDEIGRAYIKTLSMEEIRGKLK